MRVLIIKSKERADKKYDTIAITTLAVVVCYSGRMDDDYYDHRNVQYI